MKTKIALILAILMLVLCAAGCRRGTAPDTEATSAPTDAPTEVPATEAPTEAPAIEEPTEEHPDTETPEITIVDSLTDGEVEEEVFASWNDVAPALDLLIEYVETVTDESSPDFIPVGNRVAVFDMDGTIYGELFPTYLEYYMLAWRILADPTFTPDEELKAVAEEIRAGGPTHTYAGDMALRHANAAAKAYAGMTVTEFQNYVTQFLVRDADGFEGMTYGQAFYRPIVEVIDYLTENNFTVYVVSGSDRYICRELFDGMVDVPSDHFIGMDVALEASGQEDKDSLDYTFQPGDELVRTDRLQVKNLKTNKVTAIVREIGKQPVLSFGNSSGDSAMHLYTISNNPYKSLAFMLIADDDVRDYGHPEKGDELREKWEALGFNVISMRDDFKTIYGENVRKTGTFRWTEELGGNIN
jgi:hypothetical protein